MTDSPLVCLRPLAQLDAWHCLEGMQATAERLVARHLGEGRGPGFDPEQGISPK